MWIGIILSTLLALKFVLPTSVVNAFSGKKILHVSNLDGKGIIRYRLTADTIILVCSTSVIQVCVRERAAKSLLCVRDISEEKAYQLVDDVFTSCFKDTDPFECVPP